VSGLRAVVSPAAGSGGRRVAVSATAATGIVGVFGRFINAGSTAMALGLVTAWRRCAVADGATTAVLGVAGVRIRGIVVIIVARARVSRAHGD
jgi:hypothetical protein